MPTPDYVDPNRYAGMYSAPQNTSVGAPSAFSQWMWNNGDDLMSFFNPILGAGAGAAGNILSQVFQNRVQERFYNQYQSPEARMAQMKAAGINPNAAAQGISGAGAPAMSAAAPTNAFSSLGELVGNSANSMLSARVLRSEAEKNTAEANLTKSIDFEQNVKNRYADAQQKATLDKLVSDGRVSRSFANMAAVDEAYKPANAFANSQQLMMNLKRTAGEINELSARVLSEYAQVYKAMADAALDQAQIRKVFSDIGLNDAMIERIAHENAEIDSRTAFNYQGINESKARQAALEIQNRFQQDYYDIWQNTGFNWNSDIEKSIVGAYSNLDIKAGDRMMHSLGAYIEGTGYSRSMSADYTIDKVLGLVGDAVHTIGTLGGAAIIAGGSRDFGKNTAYKKSDNGGAVYYNSSGTTVGSMFPNQ